MLVADDHPIVRVGIASVLAQDSTLEVVGEAENGEQAVAMCRDRHPDVVLMDLRMPIMDGARATQIIRRDMPDTRVLALSSFDGDGFVRRALDAGASGYLLKDMLLTQLVSAVQAVHRGERVLPSAVVDRLEEHADDSPLSPRELEVLALVARGLGNKEIGGAIGRSDETVKAHLRNIFAKLGVDDRTEAVTTAVSRGLLHLAP